MSILQQFQVEKGSLICWATLFPAGEVEKGALIQLISLLTKEYGPVKFPFST